jgi:asparagine synthase (glutamine-hydrolysing)
MYNEDGSVAVVYNGEIYNHRDLARELAQRGHRFRTACDTEVIVHAWEEWGRACVERLRGMFAFALYDANRSCVFLGRDRLGIKPLYYGWSDDGRLLFGSELKALLQVAGLRRDLDPSAVEEFCALGYVPDPRSIYAAVRKLSPAHTLVQARGGDADVEPYWDVDFLDKDGRNAGLADHAEALRAGLREATEVRLMSEVPLGAFLSGGVDSGSVVAQMAQLRDDPVDTCAIAVGSGDYDESAYARMVAERYATRHNAATVDENDFALLDRLPQVYDEPYADSSAIPTYRLCEQARRHVTVALSGDGGDELFAGYRRHRWHSYEEMVRGRLPASLRARVFGLLGAAYPKMDWAPKPLRAKTTLQAIARDSADAYFHSVGLIGDRQREALYTADFKRALQGYRASDLIRSYMDAAPADDPLSQIQYVDLKTYLPGDILTKVDRASMAHGLEVRVPMLDPEMVRRAAAVPPGLRLHGREGKYAFKKAMEPDLPDDVLYRPKMGFGVPLGRWFRHDLNDAVRRRLLDGPLTDSGYFDPDMVRRLVDEHTAGRRDHAQPLWALMTFAGFLEQVHEGVPPADAA